MIKFNSKQKVKIIDESKDRRDKLINGIDEETIYIASYGSIINDYDKYTNINFQVVVIDEAQNIKNSQTKTSRVVKMLKGEHYIALTGTPIENNIMELWSIFDFLIPGYLSDYDEFSVKFVKDQTNKELLSNILKPFILLMKEFLIYPA